MAKEKPKIPRKHLTTKSLSQGYASFKNRKNPNFIPLGNGRAKQKKNQKKDKYTEEMLLRSNASSKEQLQFFFSCYQSANGIKLSSLELEGIKDTCFVELPPAMEQTAWNLSKHMKATFGSSWKEILYEGQLIDGKVDAGSPAILIISASTLRSLNLLKELKSLTKECRVAKLFSKHMKVEEQVLLLKNRVNIASGTPSRVKKLIDLDALILSRLSVLVLDMQTDAKGYTLFTLPQVRREFWDLYNSHFHQNLLQGNLRICLYGSLPILKQKDAISE